MLLEIVMWAIFIVGACCAGIGLTKTRKLLTFGLVLMLGSELVLAKVVHLSGALSTAGFVFGFVCLIIAYVIARGTNRRRRP